MRMVSPETTCTCGTALSCSRLVDGDIHDQVNAARQHLGDLGLPVGDEADLDLLDLGLRFRTSSK